MNAKGEVVWNGEEVKKLLKEILSDDGCRCDTSVCGWCRTGGWVHIAPSTVAKIREILRRELE